MQQDDRSGLLFALAGFACLSVGDAVIKTISGEWSPIAVAALRFTFGAVGLAILLGMREGVAGFRPSHPWLQLGRGFCLAMATLGFFSAIFVMPLAEATALVFLAPILTALLSGPLLGEKVRPAVWIASVAAFVGVLVILRPNVAALGVTAFLPVGAAFFMALLMIANRAAAGQGSVLSMQAYMAISAAAILAVAAFIGRASGIEILQFGWPDLSIVLRCAVVAVTASTAHWLVFMGTTRAGAASIAPMTYVQLLVASALGWWWFDDSPDLGTLAGAAIIIGAGLFLWQQGRFSRIAPAKSSKR
ncbi:DMT family transporter [Parerythrobacter jejuensis]|uniref:EamA family transporter n=1 Tax=Parerythrobacter jejuensis TaxID=795812 RepID=A0A845AQM9_9SPHN|nr:DMT family transporter [Parerythrobacter jejuensis]MXP31769.1 EamA family transporter [Parerythrobacter jejuensis]